MHLAMIAYPRVNPDLLRLGPLHVRWYGMAYLAAFAVGFAALRRLSRQGVLRIPLDAVADLVSWLAMGVLLGGRAGWWLFYHRSQGAVEPWYEPLAIWHGGMSFHGGLIGVGVLLALWARRERVPIWNLADSVALAAPAGLFFGRIANFVNAELVGRATTLPWAVVFPGETFARHPSQLYEAVLEGPVLLAVLWIATRQRHSWDGRIAAVFLIAYGAFRFMVEFTRQPDAQVGFVGFGWLTMGQLLSAATAAAGVCAWALLRKGSISLARESAPQP